MMKPRLAGYLATYAEYHRHPMNRLCHAIGIPLIVFHVVAMLDWIVLGAFGGHAMTLAMPAYVAVIGWYLTLDRRLGLAMAAWYGLCFPLARAAPWQWVVGAAAVGWVIQLLGHAVWEKRSPAFLTNLLQALIGPLYFADRVRAAIWPPHPGRGG